MTPKPPGKWYRGLKQHPEGGMRRRVSDVRRISLARRFTTPTNLGIRILPYQPDSSSRESPGKMAAVSAARRGELVTAGHPNACCEAPGRKAWPCT